MQVSEASAQIIADLLYQRTGQRLKKERHWRIAPALAALFRERGIDNFDQLVCLLADPRETQLADEVVEALLNNETYFFRDKPTFDQIADQLLPELAIRRAHRKRLSIWSAGCSSGQELRSIWMQICQNRAFWEGWSFEMLGTDISARAIAQAREGVYSQFEVQRGLSVQQMLDFFEETDRGWRFRDGGADRFCFKVHNVLDPPPAQGRFDLILCRNVLLYFDSANRAQALKRLRSALAEDGFVMVGAGESVDKHSTAFAAATGMASVYRPRTRVASEKTGPHPSKPSVERIEARRRAS